MGVFGRSDRAAQRPLGTNAKSASPSTPPERQNPEKNRGLRAKRYELKNYIGRRILAESDFDYQEPDFELFNSLPRIIKCNRTQVAPSVDIVQESSGVAHYEGVHTCGSVWDCPVCSARIMEQRRAEIAQTMEWAYFNGYKVMMVTFTAPHYRHQKCADLLSDFTAALRYFRSGKSWQNMKQNCSFQGLIRALETRIGHNGWHNHTHELWIVSQATHAESMADAIRDRWEKACRKNGMIPRGKIKAFREHAVDVIDWATTSDYLAKQDDSNNLSWGADAEITKGSYKTRGSDSLHPFQLVASLLEKPTQKAWDQYQEYTKAFKGKAAVFFSAGLKARAGINEVSDQEIADREDQDDPVKISLDGHSWRLVLHQSKETWLLDKLEALGPDAVERWLRSEKLNLLGAQKYHAGHDPVLPTVLVNDPSD